MKPRRRPPVSDVSTRVDTSAAPSLHLKKGGATDVAPEVYEAARVAFIEKGTRRAICEATGMGDQAARRLLDSGVPSRGLPPLRDAARIHAAEVEKRLGLAEKAAAKEQAEALATTVEARARAAKRARDNELAVLGDAEKSRADEVTLVRANRKSALAFAGINARLLRASSVLAESMLRDEKRLETLPLREKLHALRTIAGIVHRTAQASQVAVNMERLLMGEPTHILGRADAGPSTDDMTPEEAEQWLALANRAFARRARRRSVVDGSLATTEQSDEEIDELLEEGLSDAS